MRGEGGWGWQGFALFFPYHVSYGIMQFGYKPILVKGFGFYSCGLQNLLI